MRCTRIDLRPLQREFAIFSIATRGLFIWARDTFHSKLSAMSSALISPVLWAESASARRKTAIRAAWSGDGYQVEGFQWVAYGRVRRCAAFYEHPLFRNLLATAPLVHIGTFRAPLIPVADFPITVEVPCTSAAPRPTSEIEAI